MHYLYVFVTIRIQLQLKMFSCIIIKNLGNVWLQKISIPPTTEGISLSSPPPPPPHPHPPLRNFHKVRQSPHQPLWKSLFSRKKISKVKNDAVCGYAMVFHFLLLSAALNRNRVNYLQSNLNDKILLIPLNEREKVVSVSYICLP